MITQWAASEQPAGRKWRLVTLGELGSDETSFADGPFGSHLKTEHYRPSGARVVRLQNIGAGKFLDNDKAYISLDHFKQLRRHAVHAGDIVVAALGDGAKPAGRACLIPSGFGNGIVKADCFRVRLPAGAVHGPYAVYAMNSQQFLRQVADRIRGATRPRMTLSILRACTIPLPSLAEQKRIAAMLDEQMKSANHAAQASAVQCELVTRLSRAFLAKRFGSSDISAAATVRLGDLCRALSGGTPAKDRPDYWDGSIPWVTVKDMKGRLIGATNLTISDTAVAESAVNVAPPGTVLILVRGMGLAKGLPICELRLSAAFNQDIKGFVSDGQVMPSYLCWALRYRASEILRERQTVTHGTLKLDTESLLDVRIPLPPHAVQERIAKQLDDDLVLSDRVSVGTAEMRKAVEALPSTILRRAFTSA